MQRPPIIGITPSFQEANGDDPTWDRWTLSTTYVDAVIAAGGIPVIIPGGLTELDPLLDSLDGLLLSGGGDVEPRLYGDAEIHETTYGIVPARDQLELGLAPLALARDMPILGICRGIQVLNVAFGGSLVQDVADQWPDPIEHRQQNLGRGRDDLVHAVEAVPGSRLATIYGSESFEVNSFHHQALRDVGPGLTVVARASDGLVEAVEAPDYTFVIGVQWHPEMLFRRYPQHEAPFLAFVTAAHDYAERRQTAANLT